MNFQLEIEYSKAHILKEIDELKAEIDAKRPLPDDIEGRVMQKLRLEWNYNSNAIEGNKLNYGETVALLMHGITAKGKPLKDHLDIQGHNNAINFLLGIVKEERPFTESDIRALHKMILIEPYSVSAQTAEGQPTSKTIRLGEYKTSPNHVKTITGEIHYYATAEEVPIKMAELMEWYAEASANPEAHPIVIAALFHHKFVEIHPFDDGNGRLSRILMNLILMKNGYPPAVIKMNDKQNYYSLLSRADVGENFPFVEYIGERVQSSLNIYLKAIDGQDIEEDEDIEKRIALLKGELRADLELPTKKSPLIVKSVISNQIEPLFRRLIIRKGAFNEFFFANASAIIVQADQGSVFKQDVTEDSLHGNLVNILIDAKEVNDLSISFFFKEYRNSNYPFDLLLGFWVHFKEYKYDIGDNTEILISKLYHQGLAEEEALKIINKLISNIKQGIDQQKSPKS